mmetsp:Transcript_270/g.496  ORF Transcript_270/g.496 Transcript_270/m.496 type:complete len:235 (+) Transcript_270:517-1221(+)
MAMKKNRHTLLKRLWRVATYLSSLALFISGMAFFIIGVYFVAVFSGAMEDAVIDPVNNSTGTDNGDMQDICIKCMPTYVWIPILLGVIIMVLSVLGCCGAKYFSRLMMGVFILFTSVVIFVQLIFTAILFVDVSLLAQGLGVDEQQATSMRDIFEDSRNAVSTSFLVVLFVEIAAVAAAFFFRNQITGDEMEGKYHLDLDKQGLEGERERRRMQFEMQARQLASGEKSKRFGVF